MSSPHSSEVDVLIIGAGPAGVMCANALGKAEVNFRIIDKRPLKVSAGHADGVSPRTLEVLKSYGLVDRFLKEGGQVYMAASGFGIPGFDLTDCRYWQSFYDPGPDGGIRLSGRTQDVSAPSARYPFELNLHQGAIETIFLDSLRSMGIEVQRSTIPAKMEISTDQAELADPSSHPVKVTLERQDALEGEPREEVVRAKYVLGADGAHSWVRKTLGITMDGEQTDYIWGVLDLAPETDFPDIRKKSLVHSSNGSCLLVPCEGDEVRFYVQLTAQDVTDPRTGRVDKDKMGPEQLLEVAQASLKPYKIVPKQGISWWTLYIIGQRVASKFSVNNRVFIAGDACHTHSPKAGQGMNASINDVHNLVWKLAPVIRGWADMSLLSTYELERRKFAQDLIAFDKTLASQFSGKPLTSDNLDGISHEQFLKTFKTFGGFTSGIGVHYSPSAIVAQANRSLATNIIIGERMPPRMFLGGADAAPHELQDLIPSNFRYKLIIFTGNLEDDSQRRRVESLARDLEQPESFLKTYTSGEALGSRFDIITICKGKKEEFDFTKVPSPLRQHWSKVLIDDMDYKGVVNGRGYLYYGVSDKGVIVAVRPDGYVGTIAPLDGTTQLNDYFAQFMKA